MSRSGDVVKLALTASNPTCNFASEAKHPPVEVLGHHDNNQDRNAQGCGQTGWALLDALDT
jgi:hypothetical protein